MNSRKSVYLKANVARGFRAPNVAESGSNGIHDGTVVYEIGNPNLKPENSLEVDGAFWHQLQRCDGRAGCIQQPHS